MHIPDGFLNVATVATTYVVSAGGVGNAVRIANKKLGERQVPLMGILAAFIFAAQMLNFPVAGGTSGHLIGAALAAILLGPWASVLIMSCVLLAQSLIYYIGFVAISDKEFTPIEYISTILPGGSSLQGSDITTGASFG